MAGQDPPTAAAYSLHPIIATSCHHFVSKRTCATRLQHDMISYMIIFLGNFVLYHTAQNQGRLSETQ